jgi:YVTN family beta-propeller protein
MQAEEDTHPFLGGKPLTLFVGVGGELQGLVLSDVLRDPHTAPRSRTPIDLGAHGLALSPRAEQLGISTAAGFNVVDLDCAKRNDAVCETVSGVPAAGREARFVAVTPDGRYAFVTHGGDGKISVIDTARLSVTQVSVPTALRGGGYITAVEKGAEPIDLVAR